MSVNSVVDPTAFLSILMLQSASSQMCKMPFHANNRHTIFCYQHTIGCWSYLGSASSIYSSTCLSNVLSVYIYIYIYLRLYICQQGTTTVKCYRNYRWIKDSFINVHIESMGDNQLYGQTWWRHVSYTSVTYTLWGSGRSLSDASAIPRLDQVREDSCQIECVAQCDTCTWG